MNRSAGVAIAAIRFTDGTLWALDQTRLPWEEVELPLRSAEEIADAIRRLSIRGAPLIGVAAAYGVAIEAQRDPARVPRACEVLRGARPTAANLEWALERVRGASDPLAEARAIHAMEEAASAAIARHGAELLSECSRVLTHCNTGALAAPGRGTALAVIAELADRGGLEQVLVTESRPLLQGARLTTWELSKLGIPHELIVDSAAAGLIASGAVDAVVVGCDRVAANGDVANKVGTYALALAAGAAGIPFIVAGPTSTIDSSCPSGTQIEIEQRSADEVRGSSAPQDTACRNPAFDVTPAALVTALVTERGALRPDDPAAFSAR